MSKLLNEKYITEQIGNRKFGMISLAKIEENSKVFKLSKFLDSVALTSARVYNYTPYGLIVPMRTYKKTNISDFNLDNMINFFCQGFRIQPFGYRILLKESAKYHNVIAPDFTWLKNSPKTLKERIDCMSEFVYGVCNKYGIDACFVSGHSLGGATAKGVAKNLPNLVKKVTCVNSAMPGDYDACELAENMGVNLSKKSNGDDYRALVEGYPVGRFPYLLFQAIVRKATGVEFDKAVKLTKGLANAGYNSLKKDKDFCTAVEFAKATLINARTFFSYVQSICDYKMEDLEGIEQPVLEMHGTGEEFFPLDDKKRRRLEDMGIVVNLYPETYTHNWLIKKSLAGIAASEMNDFFVRDRWYAKLNSRIRDLKPIPLDRDINYAELDLPN